MRTIINNTITYINTPVYLHRLSWSGGGGRGLPKGGGERLMLFMLLSASANDFLSDVISLLANLKSCSVLRN